VTLIPQDKLSYFCQHFYSVKERSSRLCHPTLQPRVTAFLSSSFGHSLRRFCCFGSSIPVHARRSSVTTISFHLSQCYTFVFNLLKLCLSLSNSHSSLLSVSSSSLYASETATTGRSHFLENTPSRSSNYLQVSACSENPNIKMSSPSFIHITFHIFHSS
jgi:hypothetical protein